ncbi:MAG: NRDE family protein [Ignavibacteriaceae bacterium]
MCLLLIANKIHPEFKLIIAANRDEFYNRLAQKATFWRDQQYLLAGKDLEAGGIWMGITKSGRFSAITNYRDFNREIKQNAPTRGNLTTDFLLGNDNPEEYSEKLREKHTEYNGYNLVYGFINELYYYSNETNLVVKLEPGLYGLSNALLNTPWPKVTESKKYVSELISSGDVSKEKLFEILADKTTADDDQLPDTGIGQEREKALSSNFIETPQYGTRCSTVILINKDDKVNFTERTFEMCSKKFSDINFKFNLEKK